MDPCDLGPWTLFGPLGRGGSGEVYEAEHRTQGVRVAVKVVTAARARDEVFLEAFAREVRSVAALQHPGVVMVFDLGTVSLDASEASLDKLAVGAPYLAMERAEGSLRRKGRPTSWPRLHDALHQLLAALGHAHAAGVIHRDIKPGNVLVKGDRLMLADFGLAHTMRRADGALLGTAGTPTFMAPEQFLGDWRRFGPWTDLYALGGLAWALASGRPAFRSRSLQELRQAHLLGDLPAFEPMFEVPENLERWLRRLMVPESLDRFQRAADAADALEQMSSAMVGPTGRIRAAAVETDDTLSHSSHGDDDKVGDVEFDGGDDHLPYRMVPPLPDVATLRRSVSPTIQLVGAGLGLYGLREVPLVGREVETTQIWEALDRCRLQQGPEIVVIRGPAGAGKTRLAQWVARRAHEAGSAEVLFVRHLAASEAGLTEELLDAVSGRGLARDELAQHISRWFAHREIFDAYPGRAMLEMLWPADPDDRGRLVFSGPTERFGALRTFLTALVADQVDAGIPRPIVLVLDDAQWGPNSLALVRFLAAHPDGELPLLVLLTVRDDALADEPVATELLSRVLDLDRCMEIALPPLGPAEHGQLIKQLLMLEGDVADQVANRTDGNPLFAVQLVGDWVQRGILEVGTHGFVLASGADATLPDDIHTLWEGRIARLLEDQPPDTREALELAALLGPEVDAAEWRAACRVARARPKEGLVATLFERRLAEPRGRHWSFAHGMLRESLLRSATDEGRAVDLHDACATALQIRFEVARSPGLAERLGRHLVEAGRAAEAIEPLTLGAQERHAQSDYRAAMALYDLAQHALDVTGASPSDRRRAECAIARAGLLASIGRHEEAHDLAMATAQAFGVRWPLLQPQALRTAGFAAAKQGRLADAEALLTQAVEQAAQLGEVHERARSEQHLAELHRLRGESQQARWLALRALDAFTAVGDDRGRADALIGLVGVHVAQRELDQARDGIRQALELFESCGARFGVASATNALGDVLRLQDDLDGAADAYQRAGEILTTLGSADRLVPSLNLGLVRIAQGRHVDAEGPLADAGAVAGAAGRVAMLGVFNAAMLCCDVAREDRSAFGEHAAAAKVALEQSGIVDPDILHVLELAAAGAKELGWVRPAARAEALVEMQRRALPQ